MTTHRSQSSIHSSRFSEIKKSYKSTCLVFEMGDLASAKILAARTMALLVSMGEELKNNATPIGDFSFIEEDQKKLNQGESLVDIQDQDMLLILDHLKTSLGILDRALNSLYNPGSFGLRIFKRYIKPLVFMTLGLVLVYGVISAYHWVRYRHHGLFGEYYKDLGFTKYSFSRLDQDIDFNWSDNPPKKNFKRENYSVRWTGFLKVPDSGSYQLSMESDDGVRLWVDNSMLIDHWTDHPDTTDLVSLDLKAGYHPIKIEYFQKGGGAIVRLFWRYGSMTESQIIPPQALTPPSTS